VRLDRLLQRLRLVSARTGTTLNPVECSLDHVDCSLNRVDCFVNLVEMFRTPFRTFPESCRMFPQHMTRLIFNWYIRVCLEICTILYVLQVIFFIQYFICLTRTFKKRFLRCAALDLDVWRMPCDATFGVCRCDLYDDRICTTPLTKTDVWRLQVQPVRSHLYDAADQNRRRLFVPSRRLGRICTPRRGRTQQAPGQQRPPLPFRAPQHPCRQRGMAPHLRARCQRPRRFRQRLWRRAHQVYRSLTTFTFLCGWKPLS
jgi:hypothetical protein